MKNIYFYSLFFLLTSNLSFSQEWHFVDTDIPNSDSSFIQCSLSKDGYFLLGLGYIYGYTYLIPGGLLISKDKGATWDYITNMDSVYGISGIRALALDDSFLYAGSGVWGIYRSSDWGETWQQCNNGIPMGNSWDILFLESIQNYLYAGTLCGAYRSSNKGISWQEINTGLPFNEVGYYTVKDIKCFNDTLYASLYTWGDSTGGLYKTSINNISWEPFIIKVNYYGFVPPYFDANYFDIIGNYFFLSTNGYGPYFSTDTGYNWYNFQVIQTLIEKAEINKNNIVLGGGGIFWSSDTGSTWQVINYNLQNYFANYGYINSVDILNDKIFVGTQTRGLWSLDLSTLPTSIDRSANVLSYDLSQNYPNPFNFSTRINYSIPSTQKIILRIYDILGNEIETLVNEEKPVGTYELTWNAANLPSGVYFYQIRAGSFMNMKKMILLK